MQLDRDHTQDGRQAAVLGEEVQPVFGDACANDFHWVTKELGEFSVNKAVFVQVVGVLRDQFDALRHALQINLLRVFLGQFFEHFKLQCAIKFHGHSFRRLVMRVESTSYSIGMASYFLFLPPVHLRLHGGSFPLRLRA